MTDQEEQRQATNPKSAKAESSRIQAATAAALQRGAFQTASEAAEFCKQFGRKKKV